MPRVPSLSALARLKLHVARQASRTTQVDMVGYREAGDYGSLVFAAQEVLGHAVDALLAGYRLTNPISKWRSRLLESLPPDWERSLAVRPTGLPAGQRVWSLHRAPERPDERPALEHAFRITTFARAVFTWAESSLIKGSSAPLRAAAWPRPERGSHDSPLPYLDFDVDFFLNDGRVTLARLNEFGETIEMSPREFALTLLFDGTTTAREAELVFDGNGRGRARPGAVERLLSRVARTGFSVSPEALGGEGVEGRRASTRRAGGRRS